MSDQPQGKPPIDPVEAARLRKVHDGFENKVGLVLDPRKPTHAEQGTAPEVSQGLWRERSTTPRALLPRDALIAELKEAIENARPTDEPFPKVKTAVITAWAPLWRQVIEQAGGDGLDALVSQLRGKHPEQAKNPLLGQLMSRAKKLGEATTLEAFTPLAEEAIAFIEKALDKADRLSLKRLEVDLEGRLELLDFLGMFFSTDEQMKKRIDEMGLSLEGLRAQLRSMPGAQPGGIFWNFGRLKLEKQIWEAELKRRAS
jgi:hypothetical protein